MDLSLPAQRQALTLPLYTADSGVILRFALRDAAGHDLTPAAASARLYAIRSDGVTVILQGSIAGSEAVVTLPETCFVSPGCLLLSLCLTTGTDRRVIWSGEALVHRTDTEAVTDPGALVPSLPALLDQLERLKSFHPTAVRGFYPSREALDAAVPEPQTGDLYGVGAQGAYTYLIRDGAAWVDLGDIMRPAAASQTLWSGYCSAGSSVTVPGLSAWQMVAVSVGTASVTLAQVPCMVTETGVTGMTGEPFSSGSARSIMSFTLTAQRSGDVLTPELCGVMVHTANAAHGAWTDRSIRSVVGLVRRGA